ncbi:ER membrane protein complex subunit 7 homolog [Drosophila bipectinata]|uniref:ER membrane protein complex subunit 7 homolog n=1 Tax=Drosophila bipectinata TaxID=42026 RepID=UPI001C8A14AA|nr:ER membrane protein complex subunit 7 homolog [Drosophila bipectinata]
MDFETQLLGKNFVKIVVISIVCLFGLGHSTKETTIPSTSPGLVVNSNVTENTFHKIEGIILAPNRRFSLDKTWMSDVTLSINNGEFKGFVRLDGHFVISGVPNGSHILVVHHPDIYFSQVRIEITGKGKIRARRVSYIEPSMIHHLPYPLRLHALYRRQFFWSRQQWQFLDLILSPMVLIMVVPVILMMIIPRIINDPETKKELENIPLPKIDDMPDFGDMLSSFLSGKPPAKKEVEEAKKSTEKPKKKAH